MSKRHQYIVSSRKGQTAVHKKERRKATEHNNSVAKQLRKGKTKMQTLGHKKYGKGIR
jgi:hypothetical protein